MAEHHLSKKILRQDLLAKRKGMTEEAKAKSSLKICHHVHQYAIAHKILWIGCFAAFRNEPDLSPLLKSAKNFTLGSKTYRSALPKIFGEGVMAFYSYEEGDPVEKNIYGISEPHGLPSLEIQPGKPPLMSPRDFLLLVPALAVDRKGHRLGYGGGYYDRYLAKYPNLSSLSIVYSDFILEAIPVESHDQPINGYVSEGGINLFPSLNRL
jgi:5-formyltetrahydrofolate cyclo-ligase